MADTSKIEWTDATWNIITGCTLVDEGCRHCYAAHLITSWPAIGNHPSRKGLARKNAAGISKFTGEVRFNEDWLDQPLRWKKPRKIFVCAHGDLFHETVPDEWIDRVFAVMALAPQHTFQVLTKRPERAATYLADTSTPFRVAQAMDKLKAESAQAAYEIKPVAGYIGYFVSTDGVVYSEKRGKRRALSPDIGEQGHRRVSLSKDGVKDRFLVHRLVLETFIGAAPTPASQGRHQDGDPSHNALANLSWGDQSENWVDRKRHGNHRSYSKLTEEQASDIRIRHAHGETGEALAEEFGVSATQIRNIGRGDQWGTKAPIEWPLRSIWLGTSISDQASADQRIPHLLAAPAAVRFISAEPLLGEVDLKATRYGHMTAISRLDWVIVGGESGPHARPMHPDWARSLRDQCADAGVPFLFKQWGEWGAGQCPVGDRKGELFGCFNDAGAWVAPPVSRAFACDSGRQTMTRIGKSRAGRLLDGVEHNGFPQIGGDA